ncbi:MAG: thioester reductase domain-containing protein, partial [Actinomycetota bacterium]|nr:thioester reductase domain-containing protein [Actinomycetota bacterium]
PRVVLTKERYADRLPEGLDRIHLDEGWADGLDDVSVERARVRREDLAFVSYSSGTTGKPKGIANPHRAAVQSYLWRFGVSDYGPGDRVGCNVFFIWEMLRPLLRGATTVVIPDDVIYDPKSLVHFLKEYEITETLITPSLLDAVLNASGPGIRDQLSSLRTLWLNGEVVTRTLTRRAASLLPNARLMNVYSCSETHEVAAGDLTELVENPDSTYCPVGRPMDPDRLYILDADGSLVPDGEAGELFVGGECLARGYVNLPEKTVESFPKDPFSSEDGTRMYRTGDKARVLQDGSLEILGRVDFMVKIRGYSVELGAVEAAVETHLAVRACVVIAEGDEGEDKRLVAYVVPEEGNDERLSEWRLDPKTGRSPEVRKALRDSLPHYAVPAVFVKIEALPIHATSGKVDRAELPSPPPRPSRPAPRIESSTVQLSAEAPRPKKEALLGQIWEEVLRLDPGELRPEDDFFDLGGHSLAAAQLSSRVEEGFGVHISMPMFMRNPTVRGLCDAIEAIQNGTSNEMARLSPDELRAEVVLDVEITPESASGAKSLRDAKNVFLTGATGFLGAFLLDELLSTTQARIHCLVRPRDGEEPLETIRANLRSYGLGDAALSERVAAVVGDLGEPLLGMSDEDFDALAREVEVVIHAAAAVNLVYPYSALKAANVGGTHEVLRLAARHAAKPVHYVSTSGVFPANVGLCEEDVDLDSLAGTQENGYGQSKWVAEKLVWESAERGLPVSVYRPGNVSGHSVTGASNPRDSVGAMISGSLRLGAAPEVDGGRMEMTPVDFVAAAIARLASEPDAIGGVYHLANPDPPPAATVFDLLEELGYPLERWPYDEWNAALKAAPHSEDDPIGDILRGVAPEGDDLWDGNTYDDRHTRVALGDGGPRRPAVDKDLIETYARYFAERGWIPTPAFEEANRRG